MELEKAIDVTLTGFIRQEASVDRLGPILGAAFADVEAFYRPSGSTDGWLNIPLPDGLAARVRPEFGQLLIAPRPPARRTAAGDGRFIRLPATFHGQLEGIQAAESMAHTASSRSSYADYQSKVSVATPQTLQRFDAKVVAGLVQEATLLPGDDWSEKLAAGGSWSLIATDVEITPPPSWRYIIWEVVPLGSVISMAPLDPSYWNDTSPSETERAGIIRRRTRASCLSVTGSLLGLQRCNNARCFMFANVDSVDRLDEMQEIGPEHRTPELEGRGFGTAAPHAPAPVRVAKGAKR